MADPVVTERKHRADQHTGLPVATPTRAGYMSASDKALLDSIRAGGLVSAATGVATTAQVAILQTEIEQHAATQHASAPIVGNIVYKGVMDCSAH